MRGGAHLRNHPHKCPATSHEGRGSLAQSSTYLQQLVMRGGAHLCISPGGGGVTCTIHVSPATNVMRGGAHLHNHSYNGGNKQKKENEKGGRGGGEESDDRSHDKSEATIKSRAYHR